MRESSGPRAMDTIPSLIDEIYEAAFIPDKWYGVLDGLASIAGAHGTALFNPTSVRTHAVISPALADMTQKMLVEGWADRNTRAEKLLTIEHDGFIDEADYFSEEDTRTQPIFTEVIKPLGYGFGAHTFIRAPSGDAIIVAIEKKAVTGPVTRGAIATLDTLRPHLARPALMSSRLEFERINAAVEALQMTGLPAAVLRHDGRVLAANRLLEGFSPQVTIIANDVVRFDHGPANQLLADSLKLARRGGILTSRSFPLPRTEVAPPAVVHLVPLRGNARDIFLGASHFVVVTPIDRSRVPNAETIQGLFDLTPAEARVARSLGAGNDVVATAQQLGVSPETVRSHVKAILSKSGMTRQTDFVAAITSVRTIP